MERKHNKNIVPFAKANIVVDLDGSRHFGNEGLVNHKKRSKYLE